MKYSNHGKNPFEKLIPRYDSKGIRVFKKDGDSRTDSKGKFMLYKTYLERIAFLSQEISKYRSIKQREIDYLIELLNKNGIILPPKWFMNI